MSTRTTARGTVLTGVGCSAPTLATAAVERRLLYVIGSGPLDAVADASADRRGNARGGFHVGVGTSVRGGSGAGEDGRRGCDDAGSERGDAEYRTAGHGRIVRGVRAPVGGGFAGRRRGHARAPPAGRRVRRGGARTLPAAGIKCGPGGPVTDVRRTGSRCVGRSAAARGCSRRRNQVRSGRPGPVTQGPQGRSGLPGFRCVGRSAAARGCSRCRNQVRSGRPGHGRAPNRVPAHRMWNVLVTALEGGHGRARNRFSVHRPKSTTPAVFCCRARNSSSPMRISLKIRRMSASGCRSLKRSWSTGRSMF